MIINPSGITYFFGTQSVIPINFWFVAKDQFSYDSVYNTCKPIILHIFNDPLND